VDNTTLALAPLGPAPVSTVPAEHEPAPTPAPIPIPASPATPPAPALPAPPAPAGSVGGAPNGGRDGGGGGPSAVLQDRAIPVDLMFAGFVRLRSRAPAATDVAPLESPG
jgi:hypothetical protein